MTLYFNFLLISLTICSGQLLLETVKNVLLTPYNTNEDGANIIIVHRTDVTQTNSGWNVITTNQIGFHLQVSLDETWGFRNNQYSAIGIKIYADNNSKSFNGDILTCFSVNNNVSVTTILHLNNLQNNQIYPNPHSKLAYHDINVLVNDSKTNRSRIQKATNISNIADIPLMGLYQNGYNNSFPLFFLLKNYPFPDNDMLLGVGDEKSGEFYQVNSFNDHFPTNKGFDIYFAVANTGDSLNITAIRVYNQYYLSLAPSNEPTNEPIFNPTANTNEPTVNPTINPSISYGIAITIVFDYEILDNTQEPADIDSIIPMILRKIINEQLTDYCYINDEDYNIEIVKTVQNIFVNATIFVCGETAQQTLIAFLNDDSELKTEFITSFNNDTNLIAYPNDFILKIEPITIIYTSTTTNKTIPEKEALTDDVIFPIDIDIYIANIILTIIICIAVIISIIDMIYIKRFECYHICNVCVFVLTVCNLIIDAIISYELCMYYIRVSNDLFMLIIAISATVSVGIPYLYNKILGAFKIYIIPSHFCCLFSYSLLIISGDLYVTLQLLSSNVYVNTYNVVNKFKIRKIKAITIMTYNVPQIIIQSIFMLSILKSINPFLTASIALSVIAIISHLSLIYVSAINDCSKNKKTININSNDRYNNNHKNDNNMVFKSVQIAKLQYVPSNTYNLALNVNNYSHKYNDNDDESNEEDEELYDKIPINDHKKPTPTPTTPRSPGSRNDDNNNDMVLDNILHHVINDVINEEKEMEASHSPIIGEQDNEEQDEEEYGEEENHNIPTAYIG